MTALLKIDGLDAISPAGALATILGQKVFPKAAREVHRGLEMARSKAIDLGAERMKNPTGGWQNGLKIVKLTPFMGKLVSTSGIHSIVEDGHPEINQRKMLYRSPKVRISKQGHRYMFIPFRHKASDIPKQVKEYLKDQGSEVTGIYLEKSQQQGIDAMVARFKYLWGARAQAGNIPELGATPRLEGLIRFGRGGRHQYMTFRAISDNPKSKGRWVVPAFAGYKIFRDVEAFMTGSGIVNQIRDALAQDIQDAVGAT